jgi:hypothetical protein
MSAPDEAPTCEHCGRSLAVLGWFHKGNLVDQDGAFHEVVECFFSQRYADAVEKKMKTFAKFKAVFGEPPAGPPGKPCGCCPKEGDVHVD